MMAVFGAGRWCHLVLTAVLLAVPAACSRPVDPASLTRDGDVLRRNAVVANPGADRQLALEIQEVKVPTFLSLDPPEASFRVGPGDALRINIFGEPGMSDVIVRVDGAGYIQVPIIELVKVEGQTTRQIQKLLKKLFTVRFLEPWITVELETARSRPVFLLGQFNQPGVQYLDRPTTLLEAITLGGGLSDEAYLPGARLIRDGQVATVDLQGLLREGRLEQNVWIAPRDVIFAPRRGDMQIFVLGAVNQPRAVPFGENGRTILEALTMAQGPAPGRAQLENVRIIRSFSPVEGELIIIDVGAMLAGESVDFPLQPEDVVFVPQTAVADWNDVLAQIIPSLQLIGGVITPIALIDSLLQN